MSKALFLIVPLVFLLWGCSHQNGKASPDLVQNKSLGVTSAPRLQEYDWMSKETWNKEHEEDKAIARKGGVDLLFLGDSITAGWSQDLWNENFAAKNAANFAIGGDHTGNLLWRLQDLPKGSLDPNLIVLLAGVNNFGTLNETPDQVFLGVKAVLDEVKILMPNSKVLLLGVFPFEQKPSNFRRIQVKQLNALLTKIADEEKIFFRDYGSLLLSEDGTIDKSIMADYLHPTHLGYEKLIRALLPDIEAIM